MKHTIKRFMLGLSTIFLAGVVYAKGNDISPQNTQPVTSKNLSEAQATTNTLKNDVQDVSQQVVELQKKIKDEESKSKNKNEHLKALQSEETSMKAQAIAVAKKKALAQAAARRSSPPPVQTVTRASGGDDGGGDDGGRDD